MEYSINQKSQNQDNVSSIPWVEKYRPVEFNEIILDSSNKLIFQNVLTLNSFPNLLFYGPPGTGKTTTIINLIKSYQDKYSFISEDQILHLNASDERGIEIIRNQIYGFVKSSGLFNNSLKFVILDEIDYMTKNAQLALRYLIKDRSLNVRYILICNYISRIDDSLQNEFVKLRFNQLPTTEIHKFLNKVNINEKLNLSEEQLHAVQNTYRSDIRSMINYMQSNQLAILNTRVIDTKIFSEIDTIIASGTVTELRERLYDVSRVYNIDTKTIIKDYCSYIIRSRLSTIDNKLLKSIEHIIHNVDINLDYHTDFLFYSLIGCSS